MYHYSPLSQVPGILKHRGIHPREVLRARGIEFRDDPLRWSNRPQKAEALAGYVAIGVIRPWGMMQHDTDCVVFGIKSDILMRDGTAFIGDWSSSGDIRDLTDVDEKTGVASFDAMFDNPTTNWPSPIPGEVLIRGTISDSDVTYLYVRSQDHLDKVNRACVDAGVTLQPPYRALIRPEMFPS
ncbi:MAG: hypothetical protein OXH97_10190 [Chloroflexota bacterium]|nr:hypothetical protein [Chloroflexota bacterium]